MKYNYRLYGAILGDLAGQPYEFPAMKGPYTNVKVHNPEAHITDDTIMTLAGAFSIVHGTDIEVEYKYWGRKYPDAGYGARFKEWLKAPLRMAGTSFGNGCLMRLAPFLWLPDNLPIVIRSIQTSHDHEQSYEACFKLRSAYKNYHPFVRDRPTPVRKFTQFKVDSESTVDFCMNLCAQMVGTRRTISKAVECGGDTDTNASIVGEYQNYRFKDITKEDAEYVESKLDSFQRDILIKFNAKLNS